jgi:hypothetical protein
MPAGIRIWRPHPGQQAAAERQATLTPNEVAMARGSATAGRLGSCVARLSAAGQLQSFNALFRHQRMAAAARGESFMTYQMATAKLRLTLIPPLAAGPSRPMDSCSPTSSAPAASHEHGQDSGRGTRAHRDPGRDRGLAGGFQRTVLVGPPRIPGGYAPGRVLSIAGDEQARTRRYA